MFNEVTLIGNVGQDPDIRSFSNGGKVANLRLATSERWKDRESGEVRERTEWHSIAVFNERLIDTIEAHVRKGSMLLIKGALQTRKWQDQSGADRFSTEVVLQRYRGEMKLMPRAGGSGNEQRQGGDDYGNDYGSGDSYSQGDNNYSQGGGSYPQNQNSGGQNHRSEPDLSEDVPF